MANEKQQCAAMVWKAEGNWGRSYPCGRKSGFGPDDQYCRQHAEKFAEGDTVTWYRASVWSEYSFEIKPVEVLKETSDTLLVKGPAQATREKKTSGSYRYYRSKAEAVELYRKRVASLRKRIDDLESRVNAFDSDNVPEAGSGDSNR